MYEDIMLNKLYEREDVEDTFHQFLEEHQHKKIFRIVINKFKFTFDGFEMDNEKLGLLYKGKCVVQIFYNDIAFGGSYEKRS